MNVSDALQVLGAGLGWKADTPLEGLLAGSPDAPVTGIAACAMPSVDVLRQAIAAGHNLILCDGHPFYLYDAYWSSQPGLGAMIDAMPQAQAKHRIIAEAGLAIVRVRTAWQAARPASAARSLAAHLGLVPGPVAAGQDFVICEAPRGRVAELVRRIGPDGVRLIGDAGWRVSRVAVLPGMASPARLGAALRDAAVDAVIAGEVIEWEGGPYMIDVQATGRQCALVLTGYARSMDSDADALAQWAREAFPKIPVGALHNAGNFLWSVAGAEA